MLLPLLLLRDVGEDDFPDNGIGFVVGGGGGGGGNATIVGLPKE